MPIFVKNAPCHKEEAQIAEKVLNIGLMRFW